MALPDYLSSKILKIVFRLWKSLTGEFTVKESNGLLIWLTAEKAASIFLLNSVCSVRNGFKLKAWNMSVKHCWWNDMCWTAQLINTAPPQPYLAILCLANQRKRLIRFVLWTICNLYWYSPMDYGTGICNWIRTTRAQLSSSGTGGAPMFHFPSLSVGLGSSVA